MDFVSIISELWDKGQSAAAKRATAMFARLPHKADAQTLALAESAAKVGEIDLALDILRAVPGFPDWRDGVGLAAHLVLSIGRAAEAETLFHDMLRRWPDDEGALIGLATMQRLGGDLDGAEHQVSRLLAADGSSAPALVEAALLAALAGDRRRFAQLQAAITAAPQPDKYLLWRLIPGHAALEDWAALFEAMTFYPESRLPRLVRDLPPLPPLAPGDELHGKRVLVIGNFGLGDMIHFARYLPDLAARGCEVHFQTRSALGRLFASLDCNVTCVEVIEDVSPYDARCSLFALPHLLGQTGAATLHRPAYLKAEPVEVARWGARLPRSALRVGLVWAGNPRNVLDIGRSAPLEALAPLFCDPQISFVALQKGEALAQALGAGLADRIHVPEDFDDGPDAFIDTAAVMENLDLVVSTDTSPAHLAGALGRPGIVLAKAVPDWRWNDRDGTSLWYPTMQVMRQTSPGDWAGLAMRAAERLQELKTGKARP